jgi:hypothetical protein
MALMTAQGSQGCRVVNDTYGNTIAAVLLNVIHVANKKGRFKKIQTLVGLSVTNFRDPKAKEFRFQVSTVSLTLQRRADEPV